VLDAVRQVLAPAFIERLEKDHRALLQKRFVKAVKAQDSQGFTALHLASFNGNFAAVQFLLGMGADPKARDTLNGKEVLDYAENEQVRKYIITLSESALRGDQKSFDLLINCGKSVNSKQSIFGIAPIHNVIENADVTGSLDFLEKIISCGADVNIQDSNGWTPLHHACEAGNIEVVRTLLANRADLNKFSNKGYYPLHIAALNDRHGLIKELSSLTTL
jgi:ankyrin repeat protein